VLSTVAHYSFAAAKLLCREIDREIVVASTRRLLYSSTQLNRKH